MCSWYSTGFSSCYFAKFNLQVLWSNHRFFFLGHRPNHWYIAMSFRQSELSDKLWFPMITPVPSLQHSSICKIVHVENCQCCDFKTAVTLISGTAAFAYPFPVFFKFLWRPFSTWNLIADLQHQVSVSQSIFSVDSLVFLKALVWLFRKQNLRVLWYCGCVTLHRYLPSEGLQRGVFSLHKSASMQSSNKCISM